MVESRKINQTSTGTVIASVLQIDGFQCRWQSHIEYMSASSIQVGPGVKTFAQPFKRTRAMHKTILLTTLIGVIGMGQAMAGTVDASTRPQARPGTGHMETEMAAMSEKAATLRPRSRPDQNAIMAGKVCNYSGSQDFKSWVKDFRGKALSSGISPNVFDSVMRNASYSEHVIGKDRNQSEFKRQIWDYLDSAVSPDRVKNGRKALVKHRHSLERIEKAYGVEKEIVTAVWGLESSYGSRKGNIPVIDAVATLACDGRRGNLFGKQLIAALKILQSGDTSIDSLTGSWAGAMGHTQFIPTSYEAHAVDFTGDGKRDIWSNDPTDALASTAAYLDNAGWKKGVPWGLEVRVPEGRAFGDTMLMPSQWAKRGVLDINGKPVRDHGKARILQPGGVKGASFMVFANFDVIKKYNNADAYALGVGHLADRIAGGPPIHASWPRGYVPVTFEEKKEIQERLKKLGYPLETIDGIIGSNTRKSIVAFQQSSELPADGFPSQSLLRELRKR